MTRLALSIAGGVVVGAIAFCVLSLVCWAAVSLAGLSFNFHSGLSSGMILLFLAVQLGSAIVASWSAVRLYRRHSWSSALGASIVLAAVMAVPFLRGPSPRLVWIDLGVAALVPGVLVGSLTGRGSKPGQEVA